MATRNYVSLSKLSDFLNNLRNTFANLIHKHTLSDISDYTVDTELSSTSNNPVANSAIDAEFEAIGTAFSALESAIDDKADSTHIHDEYLSESEIDDLELISISDIDTICGTTIQIATASEVTF